MSDTLASFNRLSRGEAERRLLACCGSRAWASGVAARRPYASVAAVVQAADDVWAKLSHSDWLEAFAAHPRIGESGGRSPGSSNREQRGVMSAKEETLALLAEGNRLYEERFGHVFLISATGRSAQDVLAALRQRIENDPATELDVAAEEQRKITQLRLKSMLSS
ncbi:MAG TPA: 2-oxo-4-hydroxy-4-carboxy-5-ureidoimidazoline decarboxylase [Candidatus Dormibacteraeota bacterium]|nr:2-oxo-4-hydroxy-4-carboxy-5-ureidoimidazoline decarboxylase [Candidatus Dormibacteraeota bacterium]